MMTTRAHVEFDPLTFGVRVAVIRESPGAVQLLQWQQPAVKLADPEQYGQQATEDTWLRLPEDDARAIYEALADHFGHNGHDTRSLRRDYDAERARVDLMLRALLNQR